MNRPRGSARQWGVRSRIAVCSDAELVALIADEHRDALAELYARHAGWLVGA